MAYKSGFVAIIGRPNVGKSTLLNKILGQKVVITSEKPQTTRKRIKGILTTDKGQIIFVDTPGVNKPMYKFHEFLMEEAKLAVPDADVIIFLVDGSEKAGSGDKWIVQNLLEAKKDVIIAVNKVDTIKDIDTRDDVIKSYTDLFEGKKMPLLKISAKTGRNIDDLVKNIYRKLPKGPKYYPEEELTDQNMRAVVEEIIREKILRKTHQEVPHSVAVVVDTYKETKTMDSIQATIFVERDSQKGMIIGNKGAMLKQVGSDVRKEMEEMLNKKVFIELFVKVKKDWRKKDKALKEFGYSN